ncbi:hypothetical protein KLEB273_gp052 [Bacillus phage vB_BauM_KLEB27-3]|nr:hypothetical protein KLEB273_gp052 [Bacillus phage vB_BauM_KLEB27-3]
MKQYGNTPYGKIYKYGKYDVTTTDPESIGTDKKYRIKSIGSSRISPYVTVSSTRAFIKNKNKPDIRIRCDMGRWIYLNQAETNSKSDTFRIRSISSDGQKSKWIQSVKGSIQYKGSD